jgi:hypothetical protein
VSSAILIVAIPRSFVNTTFHPFFGTATTIPREPEGKKGKRKKKQYPSFSCVEGEESSYLGKGAGHFPPIHSTPLASVLDLFL